MDFRAVAAALEEVGYAGAATLEQDLEGGRCERALDDLRASVEALRASGFAAEAAGAEAGRRARGGADAAPAPRGGGAEPG